MVHVMDKNEMIKYLRAMQGDMTQKAFSSTIGCSTAYLSDIYSGKREPGPKVLKFVGFRKQITYKKWRKEDGEVKE